MPPRRGGKGGKLSPEGCERKKAARREAYAEQKRIEREAEPVRMALLGVGPRGHRKPRPGEKPPCGICNGSGQGDVGAYDCPDCAGTGLLTYEQVIAHYELKCELTARARRFTA